MIELRFYVPKLKFDRGEAWGEPKLQWRKREFEKNYGDDTHVAGWETWGEWQDVPTVREGEE